MIRGKNKNDNIAMLTITKLNKWKANNALIFHTNTLTYNKHFYPTSFLKITWGIQDTNGSFILWLVWSWNMPLTFTSQFFFHNPRVANDSIMVDFKRKPNKHIIQLVKEPYHNTNTFPWIYFPHPKGLKMIVVCLVYYDFRLLHWRLTN